MCVFNYTTNAKNALSVHVKGRVYFSVDDAQETALLINIRRRATPYVRSCIHMYRPYPTYIMSLFMFINTREKRSGKYGKSRVCAYIRG